MGESARQNTRTFGEILRVPGSRSLTLQVLTIRALIGAAKVRFPATGVTTAIEDALVTKSGERRSPLQRCGVATSVRGEAAVSLP